MRHRPSKKSARNSCAKKINAELVAVGIAHVGAVQVGRIVARTRRSFTAAAVGQGGLVEGLDLSRGGGSETNHGAIAKVGRTAVVGPADHKWWGVRCGVGGAMRITLRAGVS